MTKMDGDLILEGQQMRMGLINRQKLDKEARSETKNRNPTVR